MRSRFFFIGPHPSTISRVWLREVNPFGGLIFKIWCPVCAYARASAESQRKIFEIQKRQDDGWIVAPHIGNDQRKSR